MDALMNDRPLEALAWKIETEIGGASGKTVRLIPDGEVQSKHGSFILDKNAAHAIIAEFEKHKTPLPIDYEHATLGGEYSAPSGRAPAAGWIRKLFYEPGRGLMGLVDWNARAVEDIRSGAYLYLSPVVMVRKSDRRAVALHSAGMTNKPAIPAMDRLAASTRLLGLPNDDLETISMAEEPTERPAEKQGMQQIKELLIKLKGLLGVKGVTAVEILEEAILVIQGKQSPSQQQEQTATSAARVLAATLEQSQELAAMKAAEAERVADERLQVYLNKGVLVENWIPQMEAARFLAVNDPSRFEALMERAVPIIPQGKTEAPSRSTGRRSGIIGEARRVFAGDAMARKLTSELAFVDRALGDANLSKLSDDELTAYSIAKPVS